MTYNSQKKSAYALVLAALVFVFMLGFMQIDKSLYLRIGKNGYYLDRAITEKQRQAGLGGRKSLPGNEGLLFVFPQAEVQCFWMKDMQFAIDIIWLTETKTVFHIEPNVSPQSYPATYCPPGKALYVIELNAGEAAHNHLKTGQILSF